MPNRSSVNHAAMREMNTVLILKTLRLHAPISRAGLAVQTGLTKAAVSGMVRELITCRLVTESGTPAPAAAIGRPGINLELNPAAGYIVSMEVGVGFLSVITADFGLRVVERQYVETAPGEPQASIQGRISALVQDTVGELLRRGQRVFGLAVGVPGLVDIESGALLLAPNLGWRNVPMLDILQREVKVPIYVFNEANIAALGEAYLDPRQDNRFLLYVSSGVGIGGGVVLDGELLTGIRGFTGEVGHMTVDPGGQRCNCGNQGCWETVASQQALYRYIVEASERGPAISPLARMIRRLELPSVETVMQAARQGDLAAQHALDRVGHWLGIGIASLINVFGPQRVVFGGPLALAHEALLPIVQDEVQRRVFPFVGESVEIGLARYLADAVVMGGAALVHQEVIQHPLRWIE
jgi:glucokinase-like ROK family protein